ncbi:MAG: transcriptional repressor [Bdellovibrionales bacterium]|nr:transcriptional repressor [Bdellovibrionales bacterium]
MDRKKNICLSIDEIKAQLVSANVKPTAQRVAICQFVLCDADHPTADEVKLWADRNFPMMSRATIYNTLNKLVEIGLLKEVKLAHSNKVMYDNNTLHHYHFFDEKTGKLFDIDPKTVKLKANLPEEFSIKQIDVTLHGKKS